MLSSSLMRMMPFDQNFLSSIALPGFLRGLVKYLCASSIFMPVPISLLLHAPGN